MRALCVVLALASSADADERRLELGAGTAVPLAIDLEASLHAADRVVLDFSAGWMPPPYVDLINRTAVAFDGYDDLTAALIEAALDHAFVVRVGGGYQPFRFPLSFHAGYTLAALGGGLAGADVIEAKTGEDVRDDAGVEVPLASTIHLLQLGAAYRMKLSRDLVLRISLEYTQPFASATHIDVTPRTMLARERLARANAALDAYMDDTFVSHVKAPVIGLSLRWLR